MIDLSLLRLHPRDERDLIWYFQQSEGDVGMRSNFGSAILAANTGRNSGSKPVSAARAFTVSEGQHTAASHQRRILRRLEQLTARHRRTLAAAFGGVALPKRARADWFDLAPLGVSAALLYVTARRVVAAKLRREPTPRDIALDRELARFAGEEPKPSPKPKDDAMALGEFLAQLRTRTPAGAAALADLVGQARQDLALAASRYETARSR